MIDVLETLYVHVERREEGQFLLRGYGEEQRDMHPHIVKIRLFTWHVPSHYGTTLAEQEAGWLLSPYMALHYLGSDATSLHGKIVWSPEAELLRKLASCFKQALAHGWYVPSFDAWKQGGWGWRLLLPAEEKRAYAELRSESAQIGWYDTEKWFEQAVQELIEQEGGPHSAWNELRDKHVLLQHVSKGSTADEQGSCEDLEWMSEEDWLQAIGWTQDNTPFRLCLQLIEPMVGQDPEMEMEDEDNWRLKIIAQDKHDPSLLREIGPRLRPSDLPAHWLEHFSEKLEKDVEAWLRIVPILRDETRPDQLLTELTDDQAWEFMDNSSLKLLQAGFSVWLPSWWDDLMKAKPKLKAQVKSTGSSTGEGSLVGLGQLIDFDWKVALGDVDLSEAEFMQMAADKKRLMFIRGRWVQLDPAFLEQVRQTMKQVEKRRGLYFRDVLELHLLGPGNGEGEPGTGDDNQSDAGRLQIHMELNEHLHKLMLQLQQAGRIPIVKPSPSLQAELRSYQQDGFSWLLFLRSLGLGGCLADDMGLGKTVQFISYLLHTREAASRKAKKGLPVSPALLICPTSVLGNWQKELARFAPTLRVHLHYGPQRAKEGAFSAEVQSMDLVLTSYPLAQMDEEELMSVRWDVICIDEAQNIKNAYTKQSSAVRRLEGDHKIALTGTPIENRLNELWSIFDFINPGYLGNQRQFGYQYVNPIEKTRDEDRILQLQKLVKPFLLRREKKDPAIQLDLPDKNEMKAYVALTPEQGALYENVVRNLMEKIDKLTGMEKKGLILSTLTKLKQICNHPALLLKEMAIDEHAKERSIKMLRLLEMIDELRAEGDNCLIFTQFVEMGHILQQLIELERGEPVQFLHGGVPKAKRDEMVTRFQDASLPEEERCGIFILSLKAGGTGLNLVAANHVFHFDRWWNPAVENQATDRAFRIGQTKDVQVHKFVALGTLEERIDEMIERKQGLSDQIVGGGENWVTEMSTEELKDLFVLRKEWMGK
ncbi:DEAD/DEAH box helicase [Paenibacillus rigui]|uniref:ATP-dependent helicase n=1 Tax=Paenibacillus rigui TaxID=554312 RepID=A0A229UT59_9BACL|nr:DEAD/DEAH box helicase [Paenibacillus rigui]OXM86513.1 ATP-dependent helicase [Paenibacillus rigui]